MRLPVVTDLGLPGIIDVHTHFMPHSVMRKVWDVFDNADQVYGVNWPITYRTDEQTRADQLRDFGVTRFTSLIYAHKPGMARWLNQWTADFAADNPSCLHTATFYPEPDALDYTRLAIEAGAQVFKVHVQVGAFDPRDAQLDAVWATLAESGVPTVVHCGSGPIPGAFTGPGPIGEVLARYPDLPLIVAHMGAPEYGAFLDLAGQYPFVYLDTTMAFTDFMDQLAPFPADRIGQLSQLGINGRVLFGSDFPNIPYPYQHAVDSLVRLDLGDDWLRWVLHDAGARLFGT